MNIGWIDIAVCLLCVLIGYLIKCAVLLMGKDHNIVSESRFDYDQKNPINRKNFGKDNESCYTDENGVVWYRM